MKHLALILSMLSSTSFAAQAGVTVSCASIMASVDVSDAQAVQQVMQHYRDFAKDEIFAVGRLSHSLQAKLAVIEDKTRSAYSISDELEKYSDDLITSSVRSKADCKQQAERWERMYGILQSDAQTMDQALLDLRQTRHDLENLREQGLGLLIEMRRGISTLTDPDKKRVFEREANEFERTLMNIETGIAVLVTMENVWNVSRQDNADMIRTINDALAVSVPIHGIVSFAKLADQQTARLQQANATVSNAFSAALGGLAAELGQNQTAQPTLSTMAVKVSRLATQRRISSAQFKSQIEKARTQMQQALQSFTGS